MVVPSRQFWTWLILLTYITFLLIIPVLAKKVRNDANLQKENQRKETNREGKLFSLFNIVQFKNEGCSTTTSLTSGSTGSTRRNGTCYTMSECSSKGGTASGNCAAGFGVCCLFIIKSATGTINQNCTYIQNPGFPALYTATASVSYTVDKISSDVCYLRLDFSTFTIFGTGHTQDATTAGAASVAFPCIDTFAVTTAGSGRTYPTICGDNTGQHIFVDLGTGASDTGILSFTFGTPFPAGTAPSRSWDIKVTQYVCGDPNAPPEGCLQYHTGITGHFTTFNFNAPADNSLPNQQYSVCIRQENGFCCVQYQVCSGVPLAYSLSGTTDTTLTPFDAVCATDSEDYIGIADSSSQCNEGLNNVGLRSRYCGSYFNDVKLPAAPFLNAPICDCTPPFSIEVFTDNRGDHTPADRSKGVCFDWTQLPCTG